MAVARRPALPRGSRLGPPGQPAHPRPTALFGGKVEVKTIHKDITLKVPQNTKQNQRFRVKELGVLNRKAGIKGDLYLKVNIVLPKIEDLDEDLVKILEEKLPSN